LTARASGQGCPRTQGAVPEGVVASPAPDATVRHLAALRRKGCRTVVSVRVRMVKPEGVAQV